MQGKIQVIDGFYPVSVDEAIYMSGTNKTLKQLIDEGSVLDKLKLESKGKNIFNKDSCTIGTGYWKSGAKFTDVNFASFIIEVNEGETYSSKNLLEASYWGEHGTAYNDYIGAVTLTNIAGGKKFTTTKNSKFVILTYRVTDLDGEMLNLGGTLLPYEPFTGNKDLYTIANTETSPLDFSVSMAKLDNKVSYELLKNKCNSTSIAKVPLFIETHETGGNQPIHHKVLYFKDGWNGYKYWMAHTPFPYGKDSEENPCICCSNDMIKWTEPSGISNPIDAPGVIINGATVSYWSDTHIVEVNNTLEVYYRGVLNNNTIVIVKRTSANGVTWTEREIVYTASGGATVCPVVLHNGSKYQMWLFAKGQMLESNDGKTWTKVGDLSFINSSEQWHFDVIYQNGAYEMVQTAMYGQTIEYLKSYDGLKWNKIKDIIVKDTVFYPNINLYRPSFCMVNGFYNIFYTMIEEDGYRSTGLSVGINKGEPTVYGIDDSYVKFMVKPSRKPKYAHDNEFYFDNVSKKLFFAKSKGINSVWSEVSLL